MLLTRFWAIWAYPIGNPGRFTGISDRNYQAVLLGPERG